MEQAEIFKYNYYQEYFKKMSSGWNRISFDLIVSFAREGLALFNPRSILDVGCGNGIYGPVLQENGGILFGIDSSHDSIKLCQDAGYDNVVQCSAEQIEFESGRFDMVFTSEVIEHVEDYGSMLMEIHRILKSGGGMILTTTCYSTSIYQFLLSRKNGVRDFIINFARYTKGFFSLKERQLFIRHWCFQSLGGHHHGFILKELREHIERIGFDIIRSDIFYAVNPFPVVDGYCFMSVLKSRKSIIKKMILSGGRDCLNSEKGFLSDKLLLIKRLPLSWEVLPSKLHSVFSCQGFDAAADSYTIQNSSQSLAWPQQSNNKPLNKPPRILRSTINAQ